MSDGKSKSPFVIALLKLKHDSTAIFGLVVIMLAILLGAFAYIISPDNSPASNDGALELKKLPPFSKVKVVEFPNTTKPETNLLEGIVGGFESSRKYVPIDNYYFNDSYIVYSVYGSNGLITDSLNTAGFNTEELVTTRFYLLGTDLAGRDLLSRLIVGCRISLFVGFIAVTISLTIGVLVGAVSGFFRGWVDDVLMWLTTVVWSIPGIILVISISIALESRGIWVTFLAVGLTMWVEVARVVRGQILELRQKTYVEAAEAIGAGSTRIIFGHILPNILGPIIVVASSNFAAAILIEAGLSFLGLGVQPPNPSWGGMVHEGFQLMGTRNSWFLILFPGISISLLVLAFNVLGNGLRDAFDPRS